MNQRTRARKQIMLDFWQSSYPQQKSLLVFIIFMNSSSEDSDDEDLFNKKYIKLEKIAQGTYGVVWKGKNTETAQIVAIKVFKNIGNQGLPVSAVREIHMLKKLKCPYTLPPLQLHIRPKSASMVTEWKQLCLSKVIKSQTSFDVRRMMKEILKAMEGVHSNYIIHRDLKPANIVLDDLEVMNIKIIDFGMSKEVKWNKNVPMTNEVGTSFYRAPELLGGTTRYTTAIDIWAIGCIFYELLTKEVLFSADSEIQQLLMIYEELASEEQIEALIKAHPQQMKLNKLSSWSRIKSKLQSSQPLNKQLDLLANLLRVDPIKRITCTQALQHEYFY